MDRTADFPILESQVTFLILLIVSCVTLGSTLIYPFQTPFPDQDNYSYQIKKRELNEMMHLIFKPLNMVPGMTCAIHKY